METIIEYRNNLDLPIESNQLKKINYYRKLYFRNGSLVREEEFEDGKLKEGIYYILQGQNHQDILDDIAPTITWNIRSNRQIINGCDVWQSNFYENGELSDIYQLEVLFSGKLMASRSFLPDGTPITGSTFKKIYISQLLRTESDANYSFYFGKTGIIEAIMPFTEGRNRPYDRLSKFLEEDTLVDNLTTAQLQYFTNENPLVPKDRLF